MKIFVLALVFALLTTLNLEAQTVISVPAGIQELTSISFSNARGISGGFRVNYPLYDCSRILT